MTEPIYVELHAASAFSFLEGASQPEALIERAAELDMPAVALLDRNGLYGAPRFHSHAVRNGLRAHIGAEIAVADLPSRLLPSTWLPHQQTPEPSRLPLLCTSQTGYQNLCQLITRYKMREPIKCEGAATTIDLEEFSSGLICLTGGKEGPLASALAHGGERAARNLLEHLTRIFGRSNVYVELQRHSQRNQEARNQCAIGLAISLGLPLLATNGVRYATSAEREILDVFTCIRNGTDLDHAGRLLSSSSQRNLKNARSMAKLFHDLPEAIANTHLLSQRLDFKLDDLGYEFPRYPVPESDSMDSYLRKRVAEGIAKRYGPKNIQTSSRARAYKPIANSPSSRASALKVIFSSCGTSSTTAKPTTFSSRAVAAPPTLSSATPLRLPPSIPSP